MSLVWRKIQRSNKKAAKFRFIAQFQELSIQCSKKWQPSKVAVAWVHRRRRYITKDHKWEPTITDPYRGLIVWPTSNPETLEITTTLYRDSRHETFDDKEWTFIIEETTNKGKRKPIAGVNLNMRLFINEVPGTQTELKLKLKPLCEHLVGCQLQLVLACTIVKEGDAFDDDMQSIASMMSVQHTNKDIAHLPDLDDEFGSTNSFGSGSTGERSPSKCATLPAQKISEIGTKIDALKNIADDFPVVKRRSPANQSLLPAAPTDNIPSIPQRPSVSSDSQVIIPPPTLTSTPKPQATSNDSGIDAATAQTPQADSGNTSQDLLSWCQTITKSYKRVKITDFSTSWRNGLAFCAIINHFRPDLLDFDSLNQSNIRENCRLAFETAATLGVQKLIDPADMVIMAIPDKVAIMTYVFMLRNHFTGQPMPEDHHRSKTKSVTEGDTQAVSSSFCNGSSTTDSQVVFRNETQQPERQDSKKRHESRKSAKDSTGILPKVKARKSSSGTSSERSSKAGSPTNDHLALTLSTENIQKPVLMTRNQLMNPFDSDDEKTDSAPVHNNEKPAAAPLAAKETSPSETSETKFVPASPIAASTPSASRQEDLKRRAREILDSYPIDRERTPEDDERRKELKERARRLIEEAKAQTSAGRAVKISETLNFPKQDEIKQAEIDVNRRDVPKAVSAPSTRNVTPEHNWSPLKLTKIRPALTLHEGLSVAKPSGQIDFYQFGKKPAPPSSPPPVITKEALLNQHIRTRKPYPATKDSDVTSSSGAIDRFRRFGSMRGQELTQSINVLSNRLSQTIRSSSEPKEISKRQSSSVVPTRQHSSTEQDDSSLVKVDDDPLEHQLRSRGKLLAEMEELVLKQKELDRKAMEVEKRWRVVMQQASGSEEEQKLMNEFMSLLNERNMLHRREMHLNLLENISDEESRFQLVQKELGELIQIEDCEKTEVHKQRIDQLMEELINIVNKRDELMQQLLANEQGTEEDAELANDVMSQSNLLPAGEKEGCSIQ